MTPQLATAGIEDKVADELVILLEYERRPNRREMAALWEPGGAVYTALLEHYFMDAERTALIPFEFKPPLIARKKNGDYLVKYKFIARGYPVH